MEAADAAIRKVREAAYPLIFKLFGSEMPRGKERKLVLARLSQDLSRIETILGYVRRSARDDSRETLPKRLRRFQGRKREGSKSRRK